VHSSTGAFQFSILDDSEWFLGLYSLVQPRLDRDDGIAYLAYLAYLAASTCGGPLGEGILRS